VVDGCLWDDAVSLHVVAWARGLRLALASAPGIRVEIVNGYRTDAAGRTILPDLAYGGEAWALLRLTVPRSVAEADHAGDVHLVTASLAYADLDGRAAHSEAVELRLPLVSAGAFAAMPVNELVSSRIAELNAAELQEQARSQRGDWNHVQRLLQQLRAQAINSPWLSASIAELEGYARRHERELFSKEALYKAGAMRNRLAALDERLDWSAEFEAQKESFLRRKLEQGRRFSAPKENPDR
jgi:Ca-activated chloride channel family protein